MTGARVVLSGLLCAALVSCGTPRPSQPELGVPTTTARDTLQVLRNDNAPAVSPAAAEGADPVAAAVRFVCSGQQLLDTPPAQLADVIRSMWSASGADAAVVATVDQLTALREQLDSGRGATRFRQSVFATRLEKTSETNVSVSLWWVGVLSREGAATPQAQWATSLITLVREDGSWRVDAESSRPGPTPDSSSDSEPISYEEFEGRLAGFVYWPVAR